MKDKSLNTMKLKVSELEKMTNWKQSEAKKSYFF